MNKMKQSKELKKHLSSIIEILNEEKTALIQGDGNKIVEIVERKNHYIETISEFKGLNLQEDRSIMELIKEIDSLQELNLLLTNQALSFQNALLESISIGLSTASNTYSQKGNYEGTKNIGLVDHSV